MLEIETNEEHFFGTHTIFEKNSKNSFFYNVDQQKLQWLIEEAGIKRLTIEKHPALLNFNIEQNLEPTRNWLHHTACIEYTSIAKNPTLLMCNVENNLLPLQRTY